MRHFIPRIMLFVLGLAALAFGAAFSIRSQLGTSPITSLPFTVSLVSPLSVGQATMIMNAFMVVAQIAILGRRYQPIQLLQLPLGIVFGALIDVALWCIRDVTATNYLTSWALCLAGIVLMGIGVACEVVANLIMLAGEGLILAICTRTHIRFPRMKVINDVTLVLCACAVSFIGLGHLEGVREGTIAAAIGIGLVAGPVIRVLKPRFAAATD